MVGGPGQNKKAGYTVAGLHQETLRARFSLARPLGEGAETGPRGVSLEPSNSARAAIAIIQHDTGIVVPVYFPEGVDSDRWEEHLRDNVGALCEQVADPTAIVLSVDGEQFGADVADRLVAELGVSARFSPINRGKLSSASRGIRFLLERTNLRYAIIVDQDGDHFANELPNFARAAQHVACGVGTDRILILGARSSRHRPMGMLRGELEELADRILLDALSYNAAVTGKPLRLEYAAALGEFPDFHSGYKLFSRQTAADVFLGEEQRAGVSDRCYYHHAAEAVMVVEAMERGAHLGIVNRSTFNEQPISAYGLYERSQLIADMIIWPCKRLNVPLAFVEQWLANHIPRLLLNTLAPDGKAELQAVRDLVIAAFTESRGGRSSPLLQPLFV